MITAEVFQRSMPNIKESKRESDKLSSRTKKISDKECYPTNLPKPKKI